MPLHLQGQFLRGFYRVECSDLGLTCDVTKRVLTDVTCQTDMCSWNKTLERGGRSFLQLHNPYAAMFVYTVPQMDYFLTTAHFLPGAMTAPFLRYRYGSSDVRWAAALGFQKWLPPPGFDSRNVVPFAADALEPGAAVHYLPNTYYRKFGGGAPPGPKRRVPDEQRPATLSYRQALWNCGASLAVPAASGGAVWDAEASNSSGTAEEGPPPPPAPAKGMHREHDGGGRQEERRLLRSLKGLYVAVLVIAIAFVARIVPCCLS